MNLSSAEGAALLRELSHAITEIKSGIFAAVPVIAAVSGILGILLGAWLTRRSELMRLRVERRTQIFDEACRVTAASSLSFGRLTLATNIISGPDPLEITLATLDRKIETSFSRSAYTAWHAVYNSHRKIAPHAIHALARERYAERQHDEITFEQSYADARRTLEKDAFDKATRVALDALAKEIK